MKNREYYSDEYYSDKGSRAASKEAAAAAEQTKKFVKLVKQLDEREQRALLHIIKGMAALSGTEEDILF